MYFTFCKGAVLCCFTFCASCQISGASVLRILLYNHTIYEESNAEQEVEDWQDYYGQESQYAHEFLFFHAPHIAPPCRVIGILHALIWGHEQSGVIIVLIIRLQHVYKGLQDHFKEGNHEVGDQP